MELHEKLATLRAAILKMESIAVAFSGGVDSTFLLAVAYDVLGERVVAVTARSATYPERELNEAVDFASRLGVRHCVIVSEELDIPGFSANPVNRCYACKKELFLKIREVADRHRLRHVADGSNISDLDDYRPGMIAIEELGVVCPLRDAALTKEDIRRLSQEMGLPTWDKPALACLSSRIPYGLEITREKLNMVDRGEQVLREMGFKQVRVRHHGDIARIEVSPDERRLFFDEARMDRVQQSFRQIGFAYTALDLKGYRTGSMNEILDHGNGSGGVF